MLKSHIDGIDLLDVLNVLLNCKIHYIVVNYVFLQFNKCEVDIFEHHRLCDEFSHLVNACFVATRRLC